MKKTGAKRIPPRMLAIFKMKFLLLGAGIGMLIGGLAIFIVTGMNKSHVQEDTTNYHPATFAVAEKFICGCLECEMELVECNCTNSSGGTYEMYYISEKLKGGYSEAQVLHEVNKKFGHIKKQYQHLLNDE
ncbi:MAG: hypothetical protein ACE5IR_15480 [bacterium]